MQVLYPVDAAVSAGVAAVQTVTVTGSPSGGSYRLNYGEFASNRIPRAASAAAFQAALEAVPALRGGVIVVTGANGGPYTVTGQVRGPMLRLILAGNYLTGGTNPSVSSVMGTVGVASTGGGQIPPGGLLVDANNVYQNDGTAAAPLFGTIGSGGGAAVPDPAAIQTRDAQLTHAQIIHLKATPVLVVPAPGVGFALIPVYTYSWVNLAAGLYTNLINSTLRYQYSGGSGINQNSDWSFAVYQDLPYYDNIPTGDFFDNAGVLSRNNSFISDNNSLKENQALMIRHNATVELSGGNAANTVSLRIGYLKLPIGLFGGA